MVNKVILLGRLGKDPEVRNLEGGAVVANFPIATNEVYYNKNREKIEKTEWHRITVWRRNAEVAQQYLKKGDLIYLEGKLRTRSFDDKDGNKKYITEVEADSFQMLSSRADASGEAPGESNSYPSQQSAPTSGGSQGPSNLPEQDDDDLPF